MALDLRLRRRERLTLYHMGCSRLMAVEIALAEAVCVLLLAAATGAALLIPLMRVLPDPGQLLSGGA